MLGLGCKCMGAGGVSFLRGEGGWLYSRKQSELQEISAIRKNIVSSALGWLASTFVFSRVAFLFK